jgi:hypothetical protein
MNGLDLPWGWLLWGLAVILATSSLVKLANNRRDELQRKLDSYLETQLKLIQHKKKILEEHRRRVALAKKIGDESAQEVEN